MAGLLIILALVVAVALSAKTESIISDRGASPWASDDKVNGLARAIVRAEGTEGPGALGNRRNNPLDITDLSGRIREFPSYADGWNAGLDYVGRMLYGGHPAYRSDMTFAEVSRVYTGGDNPDGWAATVTDQLGITPETTLQEYLDL